MKKKTSQIREERKGTDSARKGERERRGIQKIWKIDTATEKDR